MARKKNYQANPLRRAQAATTQTTAIQSVISQLVKSGKARIDMEALLGPHARFASNERSIDFTDSLGLGIDDWVWSVLACLQCILLSGTRESSTVAQYAKSLRVFFSYLATGLASPPITKPEELSPLHIDAFTGWLQARGRQRKQTVETNRTQFKNVKSVLMEMLMRGCIPRVPRGYLKNKTLPWQHGGSRQTSLSEKEQEHVANAIKADLVAIHHGRLLLYPADVQALRLLLVAHRQGKSPTPLLELRRDAMTPGLFPGTIHMRTVKVRGRKVRNSVGRAASANARSRLESEDREIKDVVFALAEGAVLQQAINSTEDLVKEAPPRYRNRVWLYRSQANNKSRNSVTCLTSRTLAKAVSALIQRHNLVGDNGKVLRLNLTRMRKAFFDRAFRSTEGDSVKTANLMGNTPRVAGGNYPSMNEARQAGAAEFLGEDYTAMMRGSARGDGDARSEPLVIKITPVRTASDGTPTTSLDRTPVSGCKDTLNGEHAPHDGRNHCDRYVMCLFCSSFGIVGQVDELWRLFSFQAFAKAELEYLDAMLGAERTTDVALEDLRDRYRISIPYIDQFTKRQFPARIVKEARAKTRNGLHPFWVHQMNMSRRAHERQPGTQ
ncbi:hypothetical protein [Trinickia mobilis]|uniref:hypothetical protein n=1 Tax=Trinickia mobilis TaxID=2816356 RepID=UPI001A8C7A43|nr:hypothetical protein [Trinickia mobilis]